jgi:hypothetical protein
MSRKNSFQRRLKSTKIKKYENFFLNFLDLAVRQTVLKNMQTKFYSHNVTSLNYETLYPQKTATFSNQKELFALSYL